MPLSCEKAKEFGIAEAGDKLVITFGSPIGKVGTTNTVKVATA
jgi:pyruvate kinase